MKYILLTIFVFTLSFSGYSQIDNQKNAFGLRFGFNDGFEGELNYQRYLNKLRNFRLESGLGFNLETNNLDYLKFINTLQYVGNLVGDYNFYLGGGAGFGNFSSDMFNENEFILAGIVGIEWTSGIPLIFSLDLRPEYRNNPQFKNDIFYNIGLAIRFQF
tara:strand:- start:16437 stop:16916 length:480 start_codon:yes stop_codon:yes gene_type:complete